MSSANLFLFISNRRRRRILKCSLFFVRTFPTTQTKCFFSPAAARNILLDASSRLLLPQEMMKSFGLFMN
jgi:hypothetical protein